jgi:putative acetyltransferase
MLIDIKPETTEDYKDIHAVIAAAFGPVEGVAKAVFVDLLRRTESFIPALSLTAKLGGKAVGHIVFYPIAILQDGKKLGTLSLALLSVLPAFQNKGIGSALVKEGLSKAGTLGFKSVIVLGHANYYPRFGFVPVKNFGIKTPFIDPDSVFLALELELGALQDANGMIRYPAEFDGI